MLIETDDVIEANYVEIVFVNHEHELMSIVGSIVHSKKFENGKAKMINEVAEGIFRLRIGQGKNAFLYLDKTSKINFSFDQQNELLK